MKKLNKFSAIIIIMIVALHHGFAQPPQAFNYQAIARDATGNPLPDQNIGIRFTITDGNGGPVLYQETQNTTTNQFGMFILDVGNGIPVSGIFSSINWATVAPWLQVEMDPSGGINYSNMGTSQLLSVPYSLFAASSSPDISGTTNYLVKFTSALTGGNSQIFDDGTNIGFNTSAPAGKLHVKGNTDVTQLIIDANGTQGNTNPLIKLRSNSGADLMWLHSDNPANTFVGLNAGRVNNAGGTSGIQNTFIGRDAGYSNVSGFNNTSFGYQSLYSNFSGSYNTASGYQSLYSNTTGSENTANGNAALVLNTTGTRNTATGLGALFSNTTGSYNTAYGYAACFSNISGSNATAVGYNAMRNTNNAPTAFTNYNVAVGYEALRGSSTASANTGNYNTALGYQSLLSNSTGYNITANGYQSLYSNTTGYDNTANGNQALYRNTSGHSNTAVGVVALFSNTTGNYNTAIGRGTLYFNTSGNFNTGNGSNTLFANTTGNSNTATGWGSLTSNTTGNYNTANGFASLGSNSTGNNNTATGFQSLFSNTTGSYNTSSGYQSLINNTTGSFNTSNGYQALFFNTEGNENTATGYRALNFNATGTCNTANGTNALYSNSDGNENSAYGYNALENNTTGDNNVAVGSYALYSNTTASFNTAVGHQALDFNTTGFNNAAFGVGALHANTDGDQNTATGSSALYSNTTGYFNVAMGTNALLSNISSDKNTAVGVNSLRYAISAGNTSIGFSAGDFYDFSYGTFAGYNAHPTLDGFTNLTGLGYNAQPNASNQVRIGNSSVTSIGGYAGWTNLSDERFKQNVNEDVKGLEFILKLRPVTYNYAVNDLALFLEEDKKRDKEGNIISQTDPIDKLSRDSKEAIRYTGFLAQEVEAAARSIGFDFSGIDAPKNENDFYGLRYAEFVVPLVKAVQEQQVMIENLKRQNEQLLHRIEALETK